MSLLQRFVLWLDAWHLGAALRAQAVLDPSGPWVPQLLSLREYRRGQLEGLWK